MKIIQISVFLENRKGRLAEVCSLFGKNRINMRALTIAESPEFGILRVVVNKPEEARKVLKDAGFVANISEIVAVEVEDKPGSLAAILDVLNKNSVNIEYMYGFVERTGAKALMVFRFENPDAAIEILKKNKIKIIGSADIAGL